MKTKKMLIMLVAFVITFCLTATSAFAWAQYRSRTNPGNTPLGNRPWIPMPPDTLTLGDGQSVWIGIENDYVQDNQKFVLYKLPVSGPFDGSFGVAGYYNSGASHSQVVVDHLWFERGNPDTLMIGFILDPQPEWEVIKITNNSGGDVDLYFADVTVKTLCWDRETHRPVYKFTDVYHDGPDDVRNLIELTIFPENVHIDEYIQPVLYEPPGTGPWHFDFVYEDPYGNPRPLGGVRWESSGPGIGAYSMHYAFEFAMIGEPDHQYTYFVFDEYSGEYIKYDLYTGCPDVNMEPDTWPVEVLPGGRFGITGIIGNTCDEAINTDVWYGVMFNGIFYQQGRFNNIPLAPGQYRTAHLNQHVPWYAPPGEYEYCSYCGDYPYYILDEYCFPFTIIPWSIGEGADEWYLEGGFEAGEVPDQFALIGNYPNPFNATTSISFELPFAGNVVLEVYNLLGQKVATLADGRMDAGHHSINWDASSYSSGIYFYRLTAGNKVFTKRMTLLK
jgi:hypothetical protein